LTDFLASQPQYADHLLPVWFALPVEQRGTFYAVDKAAAVVRADVGEKFKRSYPPRKGPLTVVASYPDFRVAHRANRKVVLLNHGTGQSYQGTLKNHPAYVGGGSRNEVALFLEPGPYAGAITRSKGGNVVEVGVPKLDPWHKFPAEPTEPVVAISWHWHCVSGVPETDWAWPEYKESVVSLSKEVKVIGHAHPRAWLRLEKWYREVGIEPVQSFSEVLQRASVFVADNTSALYEFASTGRPVVVLNSKHYRREVEQGLRFWRDVPGMQLDYPSQLSDAIHTVLEAPEEYFYPFRSVIEKVYAYTDGKAAERAAKAILELGDEMDPYKPRRRAEVPDRQPDPPQFPLARLRRIGASSTEIMKAREVWDSMESNEEREASAAEFDAMSDVDLRKALLESEPVPNFTEMNVPEVLDWVGKSRERAEAALNQERAREQAKEGKARTTLISSLKKITDA
jgi:hypothetical protein